MSKTNFTKVEDSLNKGIDNFKIKKILDSTDTKKEEKQEIDTKRIERKKVVIRLITEFKKIAKKDDRIYLKLGTSLAKVKALLEHPSKLSEEEWNTVLKLNDKLNSYKVAFLSKEKPTSDEQLVEEERDKQVNKRFNIQDKWLPVD